MKKSPFEFNEANNYFWNRQGKKHYWGMKGKDYGLLQSLSNNRPIIEQNNGLESLKFKHIKLNSNQYDERINHSINEEKPKIGLQNSERLFLEDGGKYRNQYSTQKPSKLYNVKTQPVQYQEQQRRHRLDSSQNKKRHLSLMSKNIEISNNQTPRVQHPKRFSTLDYAEQKNRQLQEAQRKIYTRVNTEANMNDFQMKKYRERIVKVVKRDRKNNPTFCNSLAYPLHCYRYVQ